MVADEAGESDEGGERRREGRGGRERGLQKRSREGKGGIELGLSYGSGRLFYRQEGNDQNTPGGAPK